MCCGTAKWKREKVADHKFDFVDVRDFHDTGCFSQLQYVWVYVLVLKSFLVYVSDIYTAIAMLASNHWSGSIIQNAGDSSVTKVPFSIGKWIFTGCIIVSFVLLLWEARKARFIIRSRDISYAFTNVMANNYYCLKSYDHFCFFSEISNSKKRIDDLAFFVFFTFKGWKRLLIADAPRQVINALTLYSFAKANNFTTNISAYVEGSWVRAIILCTMCFTVVIWAGSAILLLIAALAYIPLLCHIRGNLKEYCCHKVDKRIGELMKRKARSRQAREAARLRKEAAGDFSHLRDKKGNYLGAPDLQPTLPNVSLDDDDDMYAAGSEYGGGGGYGSKASEAGFYGGPHTFPPHQMRYDLGDSPMPQPAYAASDYSLNSYERPPLTAANSTSSLHPDDRTMPLSKAPSYRSEAPEYTQQQQQQHHHQWTTPAGAPPVPPTPASVPDDPYAHFARHRRQQTDEELAYEPIRRTALYERSQADPYGRPDSRLSDGYGGTRPESSLTLDDVHRGYARR